MASLVYLYKSALRFIENEIDGVIGYDSSRDYFESLDKNSIRLLRLIA